MNKYEKRKAKVLENRRKRLYADPMPVIEPWMQREDVEHVMKKQDAWQEESMANPEYVKELKEKLKKFYEEHYFYFMISPDHTKGVFDPKTGKHIKQPFELRGTHGKTHYHRETGLNSYDQLEYEWECELRRLIKEDDARLVNMTGEELLQTITEDKKEEERISTGFTEIEKALKRREFKKFKWNEEKFIYEGQEMTAFEIARAVFGVTTKQDKPYQFLKLYLWRKNTPTLKKALQRLNKKYSEDNKEVWIEQKCLEHKTRGSRNRITDKLKQRLAFSWSESERAEEGRLVATVGRLAGWAVKMVQRDMKEGVTKRPKKRQATVINKSIIN